MSSQQPQVDQLEAVRKKRQAVGEEQAMSKQRQGPKASKAKGQVEGSRRTAGSWVEGRQRESGKQRKARGQGKGKGKGSQQVTALGKGGTEGRGSHMVGQKAKEGIRRVIHGWGKVAAVAELRTGQAAHTVVVMVVAVVAMAVVARMQQAAVEEAGGAAGRRLRRSLRRWQSL